VSTDAYVEEFHLHKDQLHEDALRFRQNSGYGLFWCFHCSVGLLFSCSSSSWSSCQILRALSQFNHTPKTTYFQLPV